MFYALRISIKICDNFFFHFFLSHRFCGISESQHFWRYSIVKLLDAWRMSFGCSLVVVEELKPPSIIPGPQTHPGYPAVNFFRQYPSRIHYPYKQSEDKHNTLRPGAYRTAPIKRLSLKSIQFFLPCHNSLLNLLTSRFKA